MRIMNVLALCVLYASLATAGFFTPSPGKHNSKDDDVTVNKGGVVIGIERDDGNTKVSVSPQDSHEKGYVENAKEKLEEAKERLQEASSSVVPEVVMKKGGDSANQEEEIHHKFRPGELVCDAYGKCKGKIQSHIGGTKEVAEKAANEAADKAYNAEEEAKEAVGVGVGKVKDTVADTAHKTKESVKEAVRQVSSKANDKMGGKASEMKEGAKEKVREKAKAAEEKVKTKGKRGLKKVFAYMVSPLRMVSFTGVLHLLGFASAYGMCVWVTFASNYVLARALPRQQYAMVQSKMYPAYFKAMASSVGMALLGHMMDRRRRFSPLGLGIFRGFDLMASLLMILVNLLYLEPRATKVLFERMKKEKEEGTRNEGDATIPTGGTEDLATATAAGAGAGATTEGEKREKAAAKPQNVRLSGTPLRRLNSYSSLLNAATLMFLTWHLVHLGHHLHALC